jgi:WD40 repeat protein
MKEIRMLSGHNAEIVKLANHPLANNLLASSDIEGKIAIWNTEQSFPLDI